MCQKPFMFCMLPGGHERLIRSNSPTLSFWLLNYNSPTVTFCLFPFTLSCNLSSCDSVQCVIVLLHHDSVIALIIFFGLVSRVSCGFCALRGPPPPTHTYFLLDLPTDVTYRHEIVCNNGGLELAGLQSWRAAAAQPASVCLH